jgi:hypothetical protein
VPEKTTGGLDDAFSPPLYKATNWLLLGMTQDYRRLATAYQTNASPKLIFVYPLQRNARRLLSRPIMSPDYHCRAPNLMLTADQMKTIPGLFNAMPDPRRTQGRRHRLSTILAISTGAIFCGRIGYKGIAQWAKSLGQDMRARALTAATNRDVTTSLASRRFEDGIVITADALLTQRAFAEHLVEDCKAHYHFTVKGNQKT